MTIKYYMRFLLLALFILPFTANAQVKPFFNLNAGAEVNGTATFQMDGAAGLKVKDFIYAGISARIGNVSSTNKAYQFYPIFAKVGVIDNKKTGLLLFVEPGIISKTTHFTNGSGNEVHSKTNNGFYYNVSGGIKLLKSKNVSPVITAGYSSYNIDMAAGNYSKGFFSARAGIMF